MEGATPQLVIDKFHIGPTILNYAKDEEAVQFIQARIEEARDEIQVDPNIARIYTQGTEPQRNTLRALEATKAASESLKRVEFSRLFGQAPNIRVLEPEDFDRVMAMLEVDIKNLTNALLGVNPESVRGKPIHNGFSLAQDGNLPIGLNTIW